MEGIGAGSAAQRPIGQRLPAIHVWLVAIRGPDDPEPRCSSYRGGTRVPVGYDRPFCGVCRPAEPCPAGAAARGGRGWARGESGSAAFPGARRSERGGPDPSSVVGRRPGPEARPFLRRFPAAICSPLAHLTGIWADGIVGASVGLSTWVTLSLFVCPTHDRSQPTSGIQLADCRLRGWAFRP
jgi:hypothetical protein